LKGFNLKVVSLTRPLIFEHVTACSVITSLVSQPHSQCRLLSVSACGGRVWRLRTTLHGSLWEFE